MPSREVFLTPGEVYHVFNRGITNQLTFLDTRDYDHLLETCVYYQKLASPVRFSYFIRLSKSLKQEILQRRDKGVSGIEIIAFCLMPNHFHLLVKQLTDQGITDFLRKVTNSYTRYFNTHRRRNGPLFQGRFKAVKIDNGQQLLHVSRYIHLNPYSAGIVNKFSDLENYPYSSFKQFTHEYYNQTCNPKIILELFSDRQAYRQFVLNNADYQRELHHIKHLLIDT
ncbi:hypothetical protein A2379_04260 [Candidatus Amesbacteria bacterium RIFOXYB1_FULL_47_13]|nr:MAG: hypothetical protein A2379_04260 [Candidatus Amesbacteria bacterium RIFOXYB1_FULL_47_13]HBC72735.1 hypothetical protein [Candidatus Amesbacteria bacterium]